MCGGIYAISSYWSSLCIKGTLPISKLSNVCSSHVFRATGYCLRASIEALQVYYYANTRTTHTTQVQLMACKYWTSQSECNTEVHDKSKLLDLQFNAPVP